MKYLTGFLLAITICSIALNVAQYRGVLNAPVLVKIQQTDDQKVAGVFNGGNS